MKRRREGSVKRGTRLWKILLLSFAAATVLVACAAKCPEGAPLPQRPILESIEERLGGICLDESDTRELLLYLDELENRP